MMKRTLVGIVMLLMVTGAAFAATSSGSMSVSATVTNDCTITNSAAMNFGSLGVGFLSADATTSTTISYTCTIGTAPTVTIGQGSHTAGGSTAGAPLRQMANGANVIRYDLFSDSSRTVVWGDTVGTGVAPGAATGISQNISVYGKAYSANVPPGSYSDTVTLTIAF